MPAIGALESSAECWRRTLSSTFPSIRDLAHLTDPRARAQAIGRLLAEHQAALMDLARLRRERSLSSARPGSPRLRLRRCSA
ncbi:MAG: hypothetical protein ACRDYA_10260 [Egibacteraceae bacterium]